MLAEEAEDSLASEEPGDGTFADDEDSLGLEGQHRAKSRFQGVIVADGGHCWDGIDDGREWLVLVYKPNCTFQKGHATENTIWATDLWFVLVQSYCFDQDVVLGFESSDDITNRGVLIYLSNIVYLGRIYTSSK